MTSRCVVTDQQVILSYDDARRNRVLSNEDVASGRYLEEQEATITWTGTTNTEYDDNPEGLGTAFIEQTGDSPGNFTEDFQTLLVDGEGCSDGSRRRKLSLSRRLNEEETCFQLPCVEEVTSVEAIVTQAPSLAPSESGAPSGQPSGSPSGSPSITGSEAPSIEPTPVTQAPSLAPSESGAPSGQPSGSPSGSPSITGSEAPSIEPTPFPSASPSVAPSGRPSRYCPNVVDRCLNGGFFSPYTCQCLCLSPYCPDTSNADPDKRQCTKTTCDADYHDTLFDDLPAPWFSFGSSCTSSKELPSSVNAIYPSKEECCEKEHRNDSGCLTRPAEIWRLTHYGKFQLVDYDCQNSSGNVRASTAGNFVKSILKVLCEDSGLACRNDDKVVVTSLCGDNVNAEATYTSSGRRLADADENTLEFYFTSLGLDDDILEQVDDLLSAYLSGASLDSFLVDVLADGE